MKERSVQRRADDEESRRAFEIVFESRAVARRARGASSSFVFNPRARRGRARRRPARVLALARRARLQRLAQDVTERHDARGRHRGAKHGDRDAPASGDTGGTPRRPARASMRVVGVDARATTRAIVFGDRATPRRTARARARGGAAANARTRRAVMRRRDARARATNDEDDEEDDDEDASTTPRRAGADASDPARARAEGDAYVQDKLERELRLRGKIYRAERELEEKKEEIADMGETNKNTIDAEADLVRDRASLEIGMVAGELDAELAALADEAQAARERNARVKKEIEELAEELLGSGQRVNKDSKPAPGSLSELKMKAVEAEADAVDKRMQATLQDTQRATTYTMVLLLLSFLGFTLVAEGAYDKFAAVAGAFALVAYQSRAELQAKSKGKQR